jgi:hypothetical protein
LVKEKIYPENNLDKGLLGGGLNFVFVLFFVAYFNREIRLIKQSQFLTASYLLPRFRFVEIY